jgi:magnesium transporter
VATVHEGRVAAFEAFTEQMRGETRLGKLDAAALVTALVDEVLSIYLAHVEALERVVDALDEIALRGDAPDRYLQDVIDLRRRIGRLRRVLAPHREAFAPLARPDFEIEDFGSPWPGLLDRLERTLDAIENVRSVLIGSVELHMSSTSQRVNDVMKRLTVISAVLLPASVLSGIMGMNFPQPFFDQPANFFIVLAAMVAIAATTLLIAWRKGWL